MICKKNATKMEVQLLGLGGRGFTLVELLITIVVLSFGALAILKMQSAALIGNSMASKQTIASFLAESELERLKSLTFSELTEEGAYGGYEKKLNQRGEECRLYQCQSYFYTMTTYYFLYVPTSFSHQVEVKVRWRDIQGFRQIIYSAVISNYSF